MATELEMTKKAYDLTKSLGKADRRDLEVGVNDGKNGLKKADWKKKLLKDFWWKLAITLAILALVIFAVYKIIDDSKAPSSSSSKGKTTSDGARPTKQSPTVLRTHKTKPNYECERGSIANSSAAFTFKPHNGSRYRAHGLEYPFDVIAKKAKLESVLTELTTSSSGAHYYYNVDRCRIGGAVQTHKQPYIRGPLVFAIDQDCRRVYYFREEFGWIKYKSAINISCSSHGLATINATVNISQCKEGAIRDSYSYFTFTTANSRTAYRTRGLEFPFETLHKKIKMTLNITELNKTVAATTKVHYYYNIDRCRIGGGIRVDQQPHIRGPLVFAVDKECRRAYYYDEGPGWRMYITARNFNCSRHGKPEAGEDRPVCGQEGIEDSGAKNIFQWTFSSPEDGITALEFDYNVLAKKLKKSNRKLNPIDTFNNTGFNYLLNMKICLPSSVSKQPSFNNKRPPLVLAVNRACTKTYVFDESSDKWRSRELAGPLSCSWTDHSWCEQDSVKNSSASFQFLSYKSQVNVSGFRYNFTSLLRKLRGLITSEDLDKIHKHNLAGVKYYLNGQRCMNGGLVNMNASPQIRGPLYFAIDDKCSKAYYFSTRQTQWRPYLSGRGIKCMGN